MDIPRQEHNFKPVKQVDIKKLSPSEEIAKEGLIDQGAWKDAKIKQILESGGDFKIKELKTGDKVYGFNTAGKGKDLNTSAYWLDESGYQDVKKKFYREGAWDKEGVKNYLALPCFNRANAIDTAEITKSTTAVQSKIGKASEIIQYKGDNGYSTGILGKIMPGGGQQVTVDPKVLELVSG